MNTSKAEGHITEVFGSFQGEGPHIGERHVFARFSRCSLGCAYCDTPTAGDREEYASVERGPGLGDIYLPNPLDADTVANAVLSQELFPGFNKALSVTGGEPLEQSEFLRAVLDRLEGRLKVLLETNGTRVSEFMDVRDMVDIVSMDVKLPSATGLAPLWDEHGEFLDAAKGKELVVKAVVSGTTPLEEVSTAATLVSRHAPGCVFVLQPMTGPGGKPHAGGDILLKHYMVARNLIEDVRVIPQAHKILGVR